MPYEAFTIETFSTGLDLDQIPESAPDDSFAEITNAHIRYGYVERRSGFEFFGFMVHGPARTITNITQADPGVVTTSVAHGFTNGQQILITGVTGMTEVNNKRFTIANAVGNTFEIVDTSGFTAYAGAGRAILSPGNRIMGIHQYIQSAGTRETLIFDTLRAAKYNGGTDVFDPLDTQDIFSSTDSDFIWGANWQSSDVVNRLYFTNGLQWNGVAPPGDRNGIRFYDGGTTTTLFNPSLGATSLGGTRTLYGAKLLFVLASRLIALFTYEHNSDTGVVTTNPQRARWCQIQGPSNWNDLTPGGGNFRDAGTGEQIISGRILQDRIIVFFTNSVWALIATRNPNDPFRWIKINDFRATNGKMATAQYDRYVVALGLRGITATDGNETRRVDERIKDFVDDQINQAGIDRLFAQRSYDNERWWTLYPGGENDTEITNALIFNEESSSYSTYEIAMNVLGYGNVSYDYTLEDFNESNGLDFTLEDYPNDTDDLQSFFYQEDQDILLGGDTEGTIFVMEKGGNDNGEGFSTVLETASWNPYKQEGVECQLGYVDLYVDVDESAIAVVDFFKDSENIPYASQLIDFLPNLNFITQIVGIQQTNPAALDVPGHGLSTGDLIFVYGVFGMTEINGFQYQVTVVNENQITLDGIDATGFSAYTGGGALYEKGLYRVEGRTWKRAYAGGTGYQHRMRISMSGTNRSLRLHKIKRYFQRRGKRTIS